MSEDQRIRNLEDQVARLNYLVERLIGGRYTNDPLVRVVAPLDHTHCRIERADGTFLLIPDPALKEKVNYCFPDGIQGKRE